ncbi:ABC transporter permease [Caldalkalibacillus thermarum TA2.A1]|uniref:ABC transporter permease n=1 Tax=Caldalkalibacillus thermarum (strain TA2.A1) TaxID=986075 RepID=A0A8X8I6L7_CALTT|nr:ABC transporter permease [Caldalkalibacillus thermarum TA2.A1]
MFLMVTLGLFLGGGGSTTIKAAWVDLDESAYSLLLEEHFRALDALRLEEWADVEEANMALEKGYLSFIIVVPPGYGRAVEHGGNTEPLQIYYDEVDQSLAELGFALIDQVLHQQNKELVHFEDIVTYFPMFFLGGIFFPITNMPEFLQPLVYAIPISHLSDCLRQVMNLGYGIGDLWWSTLILTVWFMTSFAVSAWVFKWE